MEDIVSLVVLEVFESETRTLCLHVYPESSGSLSNHEVVDWIGGFPLDM